MVGLPRHASLQVAADCGVGIKRLSPMSPLAAVAQRDPDGTGSYTVAAKSRGWRPVWLGADL